MKRLVCSNTRSPSYRKVSVNSRFDIGKSTSMILGNLRASFMATSVPLRRGGWGGGFRYAPARYFLAVADNDSAFFARYLLARLGKIGSRRAFCVAQVECITA